MNKKYRLPVKPKQKTGIERSCMRQTTKNLLILKGMKIRLVITEKKYKIIIDDISGREITKPITLISFDINNKKEFSQLSDEIENNLRSCMTVKDLLMSIKTENFDILISFTDKYTICVVDKLKNYDTIYILTTFENTRGEIDIINIRRLFKKPIYDEDKIIDKSIISSQYMYRYNGDDTIDFIKL